VVCICTEVVASVSLVVVGETVVVGATVLVGATVVVGEVVACVVVGVCVVLLGVAGLGLDVFTLRRGFLVVVTSANDLKGSNAGVLTNADFSNAPL